ncbi:hypothetical protein EGW08_010405 [Elysia chlorotica]|uniref:Rhabdovirus nucleocapsid domain-containing protein n=1 Tax=Elysia chlorotica TaxID=188477 RepID=A0A3S1HLA0_ELYCH|nr:hypothetical protein EGW08_010405 [Elysia chlorotica]
MKKNFKNVLAEDVTCFGKVIVQKGAITPLGLLNVTWGNSTHSGLSASGVVSCPADINRLALSMMALYRICKVDHAQNEYRNSLIDKVSGLTSSTPFAEGTFPISQFLSLWDRALGIVTDTKFKRLLSAFDMYLSIFQNDDTALYRAATIVTRFEDCAMLGLIGLVSKVISKSVYHALSLCFDEQAAKEMFKMYEKESGEIAREISYLPYCRSMGLVNRSPYSVPSNVAFYTYYTTLLACMGNSRGLNAVHLDSAPVTRMIGVTLRIAYVLRSSNKQAMRFIAPPSDDDQTQTSGPPTPQSDVYDLANITESEPEEAEIWANKILMKLKLIPTTELEKLISSNPSSDLRDNSIGKTVRSYRVTTFDDED